MSVIHHERSHSGVWLHVGGMQVTLKTVVIRADNTNVAGYDATELRLDTTLPTSGAEHR